MLRFTRQNQILRRAVVAASTFGTTSSLFFKNQQQQFTGSAVTAVVQHNNNNVANVIMMAEPRRFTTTNSASGFDSNPLHKKLDALIHKGRIVVFLTGTPDAPRCGFTVRMVELLEQLPIKYEFVNIMEDDEVCEGLKAYSQWPTYPQLYIDGELVGGWDVTRQMVMDGTLIKELQNKGLLLEE